MATTRRRRKPNSAVAAPGDERVRAIAADRKPDTGPDRPTPCRACGVAVEPTGRPGWRSCPRHDPPKALTHHGIAAEVLGHPVREEDARRLVSSGVFPPLLFVAVNNFAGPYAPPVTEPWAHVDAETRKALAAELDGLEPTGLVSCYDGACAFCGTETSQANPKTGYPAWSASPFRRPLCAKCAEAYDRHGGDPASNLDSHGARVARVVAATGYAGSDAGYIDIPAAMQRPDAGDGRAWSHVDPDGLARLRLALWGKFGGRYAPADMRDIAVRVHDVNEAKHRRDAQPEPEHDLWAL